MKRVLAVLALLFLAAQPALAQKEDPREPHPVVQFSEEDAEMNAAIAEARRTYPQFLADFDAAPAGRRQFYLIKVGLATAEGGREHIWVNALRREDGRLVGALANEPMHLPGMHVGSPVEVLEDEVSDWAITSSDGMYGNYTTRVMLPHLDAAEAEEIRRMLATSPVPAHWSS